MTRLTNGTATVLLLSLVCLVFIASEVQARIVGPTGSRSRSSHQSSHEFILEGGLAEPGDELKGDFWTTEQGMGAGTGYELGLRFRQYVGDWFAVSPAFHYTRFGSAEGVLDDGYGTVPYSITVSNYRYSLDFQAFMGPGHGAFRPFLTGGISLINNRYKDEVQYGGTYKTSINTPAYHGGVGFKMRNIELVGEYHYNRFDSANLPPTDGTRTYDWDYVAIRVAFAFGR